MSPELPFIAAGGVAIVGGTIREHGWPSKGPEAVLGTIILAVVASASADTPLAPLVHALGLLLLLTTVMTTVNAVNASKKKGKTTK